MAGVAPVELIVSHSYLHKKLTLPSVARGVESGLFRGDIHPGALLEIFGGAIQSALRLVHRGQLGFEEASAAAASVFLDGARAR